MRRLLAVQIVAGAVLVTGWVGYQQVSADHGRDHQVNECQVVKEGGRPRYHDGEVVEREYWQTFRCEDGYEFTQVWPESTIRNTFGNALREDS